MIYLLDTVWRIKVVSHSDRTSVKAYEQESIPYNHYILLTTRTLVNYQRRNY
ncbi:hypothetical protein [Aerosakkonema sp. BLCC-F183]|uniref:hypothetical protein n=1 Tax=Aerosakkonema sp. BLCC-F183 TaxID=3342834 RepID=UPI0035BC1C49